MSAASEIATAKLLSGYNCAQAVLHASRDEAGLGEDTALKIATGLGAGMGRKQEVCGAVTGGILVLGLRHGRGSTDGRSATEQTYLKTRELMDRFAAIHGSCVCRELLQGCDLTTEEGQRRFKAADLLNEVCKPCVQTVVEILEQVK
jgi:C_GCAxxG_C_C family probable redox protein